MRYSFTGFEKGAARILVTTSTYARQLVHVKSRLIIDAGTATEEAGGNSIQREEYTKSDLTQKICCAQPSERGSTSICVVMIERGLKDKHERVWLKPIPLESQFIEIFID